MNTAWQTGNVDQRPSHSIDYLLVKILDSANRESPSFLWETGKKQKQKQTSVFDFEIILQNITLAKCI